MFNQLTYAKPKTLLGRDGDLGVYTSVSYRSLTHQFSYRIPALDQEQYALLNAGLYWTSADGDLKFIGAWLQPDRSARHRRRI